MSDVLQLPRPWRLLRKSAWSLAEAAALPLGAYLAGNALAGRDAGLLAGLAVAWLIVAARKVITGQVPGLVMICALVLSVQTALVFATGQTWIYLLQFPIAKLTLSLWFARSAPTEHPLVSRLATEVVALRHGGAGHPGLHRFFQHATWLWAAIFGLLAMVFAALVATQPITFFLLVSTAITVIAIGFGAGASTLWFFKVLRRNNLRLAFAS
jgi:hypothetical protein